MRKRMMEKLRKISTMYYLKQILACLLVCYILFGIPVQVARAVVPPAPLALPQTPSTPYGGVGAYDYDTTTNPFAPRLDILSVQNGAVINWQNFDIGALATTQFHQVADNAAVLNRVLGPGQTGIFGSLLANGTVFIVNTRGIVFGPQAFIDARNMVASGIDILDTDFRDSVLAGNNEFQFQKNYEYIYSDQIGNVEIQGLTMGSAYSERLALIGQNVINKGTILAGQDKCIIMAAGESAFLSWDGSDVVVQVDMTTSPANHKVDNGDSSGTGPGTINAPGGKVILAAGDIFSTAISGIDSLAAEAHRDITLQGDITANSTIHIGADKEPNGDGDVVAKGTLIANGKDPAGTSMVVTGDEVTLEKDAAAAGDMILSADRNGGGIGNLSVQGKLTTTDGGNIKMAGGYQTGEGIHLQYDSVEPEVEADGSILLNSDTYAVDGVKLDADYDVILANGKTMTGYGALTVEADNDVDLGGAVTAAGDMILTADRIGGGAGKLLVKGKLTTSDGGNIEMSGGHYTDEGIHLQYDGIEPEVEAAGDIILHEDTYAVDGVKLAAGQDVILADGETMTGAGVLTVEANRDVTLGGAVTAGGTLTLKADADLEDGGDVTAKGAVTSEGGNVDIAGNLIELKEDVRAEGGDLTITGRTSEFVLEEPETPIERYWGYIDVEADKTLYASHDVKLIDAFGSGGVEPPAGKMDLFGLGSLVIEAEGGEITTEGPWGPDGVKITVQNQNTSPASLTMKQADPLNLVDYSFGNQNNTDLTLVSYNGSVAAVDSDQLFTLGVMGKDENAADQWLSIGATAFTDITLQGHDLERDITAKALTSNAIDPYIGNIIVTSDNRKVLATGEIIADNGSVTLSAINTQNGGIELHANVTSGDSQDYIGDVELKNDVTAWSTGGSDITFTGTIDGHHALNVNTAGVTKFQGVIGGTEPLFSLTTDAPGRTEIQSGIINLNGASAYFGDPVLLTDHLTINEASTGDVEFASTVDSAVGHNYWLTVNSGAGATIFNGAVGSGSLAGSESTGLGRVTTNSAGTTQINGGSVTTNGNQYYYDPVTLGDNTTLNGKYVTFAKTLDSDSGNKWSLLVNASDVTTFNGIVGGVDRLSRLETDAAGRTEINAGTINLDGASAKFGDPVLLMNDLIIDEDGGGNVEFASTVDSADGYNYSLAVYNSGATIFGGAVGSGSLLGSEPTGLNYVWTDALGSTQINGGSVTTTNYQAYWDPVTLGADTTLSSTNVRFGQTLNSDSDNKRSLLVNASGVTRFDGIVGGDDRLSRLETDAAGRTEIGAGTINLEGASAKFGDPVLLTNDLIIDEDGGGNVEFASTVDSEENYNYSLAVYNSGATIFGGAVGSGSLLGSELTGLGYVWTDALGSTQINGGSVTTTNYQAYWDPVTLGDNTTLNSTDVRFGQTLNSDSGNKRSLLVNASGVTRFDGIVGGVDRLSHLETDAAGRTEINAGTINLDGASAKFGDPVLLTKNLTIDEDGAGNVEFADTIDSADGYNYGLWVYNSGATIFNGAVGSDALGPLSQDTGLNFVWTDDDGTTQINGGSVTTYYDQTYRDPVTLGDNTTLNGTNVNFVNTLDSDSGNNWSLLVNASGITNFLDEVGGIDALASLETDADAGGTDSTLIFTNVTTTGTQTYNDDVDLMGNVTAESTGDAEIKFAKTVDGGHDLIVNTGGNTRFGGNVGSDIPPLTTLTTDAGGTTYVSGNVTTTSGIHFGDNVYADGGEQRFFAGLGTLDADMSIVKATAGNLNLGGEAGIELGGNVLGTGGFGAGDTITFENAVTADGGEQSFDAGPGTLDADGHITKTTAGDLNLGGDSGILLAGDVITDVDGDSALYWLTFEDAVTADGEASQRFAAGDGDWQKSSLRANEKIDKTETGNLTIDGYGIYLYGDVDVLTAGGSLFIGSDYDAATKDFGTLGINLYGNLTAEQDVTLTGNSQRFQREGHQTVIATNGKVSMLGNSDLGGGYVRKQNGGDLLISGGSDELAVDIELPIEVEDGGNLWLIGNGDIQVSGDLNAAPYSAEPPYGGVAIVSENGRIYTEGTDGLNVSVTGYSDHLEQIGVYELEVDEQTGEPIFYDYVGEGDELIPRAAIVIKSKEDLKLGPDSALIAYGNYIPLQVIDLDGIESVEELINYLEGLYDEFGGVIEGLFEGFEDYVYDLGYSEGDFDDPASFPLLMELLADYLAGLDDRPAIGLLDEPAIIDGVLRDEGEPIDVAIYLASTEGDVDFSGSASITSYELVRNHAIGNNNEGPYIPEFEPQGTMVIDAYDTVTLGDFGETPEAGIWNLYGYASLEDLLDDFEYDNLEDLLDDYGTLELFFTEMFPEGPEGPPVEPEGRFFDVSRLEVVSRITEWLFQASIYGTLPYPYNPEVVEAFIGGDYILRGAGLDNPDIAATTDGRGKAWVLEDPTNPAPLYQEAGQTIEPLTLGVAGCPVLVAAASAELGIPSDTIQVSLANSFALNTNIQPCESCARLLNAADILSDEDGSGMAALNQVFNTVAPADVAFTPEVAASIVTAFAGRVGDGTQYATAIDYIDAFVRYIAVLDAEMGSPVGDGDSIAFVMEKYGTGITENENSNIAAFIATRLESGETFGE